MRLRRLKINAFFLLGLGLTGVQAQTSVNAIGGNAWGSGGSANYSIGQVFYQAHSRTNTSIIEGVQQSYEILVVTQIEKVKGINLTFSAYPNPTIDILTLEVKKSDLSNLNYQLYNIQGKLLQSHKITEPKTNIIMSHLVPSVYFIKVTEGQLGDQQENRVNKYLDYDDLFALYDNDLKSVC